MKQLQLRLTLFSILMSVLTFGLPSCKGKNKDADIRTAIQSRTASDANFAGVNATVNEGTVTLNGQCADENCRTSAEQAVKGIDGVKKVVNNITVVPVTIAPDNQLQTNVTNVVSRYPGVQADVSNGQVTLRGQIENRDQLQQLMMELSSLNAGKINNQLTINNK